MTSARQCRDIIAPLARRSRGVSARSSGRGGLRVSGPDRSGRSSDTMVDAAPPIRGAPLEIVSHAARYQLHPRRRTDAAAVGDCSRGTLAKT